MRAKYIQSLCHKKQRDEDRLFIAEGPKLAAELLSQRRMAVHSIYALPSWISSATEILKDFNRENLFTLSAPDLERISALKTPNQVLLLVQMADDQPQADPAVQPVLVLDTIQDPGNLGTIIRTADWFGIRHLVCSPDCADIYNPKVVQSTMGAISRVQVEYAELAPWLAAHAGAPVYAALLEGEDAGKLHGLTHGALLIGNESRGISPELLAHVQHPVTIPGRGETESLNAAVASGILMYQLFGSKS